MKHLILDANNLIFRARHSCYRRTYDNVIIHTFFRSLKPIIEKFSPALYGSLGLFLPLIAVESPFLKLMVI